MEKCVGYIIEEIGKLMVGMVNREKGRLEEWGVMLVMIGIGE